MSCPHCGLTHDPGFPRCPVTGRRLGGGGGIAIPDDERLGQVLAGRYRIEALLGRGAMGRVYRATQERGGGAVAVKILAPDSRQVSRGAARLLRECRIGGQLHHRNVVRYTDAGTARDGAPFVVMELLHGESLRQRLDREGEIGLDESAEIVTQVLVGLEALHGAGVIHRDLKPDNIFLEDACGRRACVKLLDFGLAKSLLEEGPGLTETGDVVGTPLYLSPEQAMGRRREVDHRADIWAVGALLHEMLTGTPPFPGSSFSQIVIQIVGSRPPRASSLRPGLPGLVDTLLLTAMSRPRESRFQSAAEMREALASVMRASRAAAVNDEPKVADMLRTTLPGRDRR